MREFIGRQVEIEKLRTLLSKQSASLIVVKGRRRIGKSRLLREFGQFFEKQITLSGLPPSRSTTAASERDEFRKQLSRELGLRGISADDWGDLFWQLAQQTREGSVLIVLDEITWMGCSDPDFLGKLKNAWDLYFSQNSNLILALSGSMSAWIDQNILSSTGFLGRESLTLTLRELPLNVCKEFWTRSGIQATPYEMLRYLAVTGGVPRYLEELNPKLSSEENIRHLAYSESGILFDEFEKIFSDLFLNRNVFYKNIVKSLASGSNSQGEITKLSKIKSQSDMGSYLDELEKSGFITRDFTWNIDDACDSNLSYYRLSDNYSRFYLKYILPNKTKIVRGLFQEGCLSSLPGWSTIMGLQIENLVLNNCKLIQKILSIPASEIQNHGPFFQRKTQRQPGCQIDYMIQTRSRTLYVCEIKFSRNVIGMQVIEDVKKKISSIITPKQFFCRPVLIHVNGISDEVQDSQYFSDIIDMKTLFDD